MIILFILTFFNVINILPSCWGKLRLIRFENNYELFKFIQSIVYIGSFCFQIWFWFHKYGVI